MTSSLQHDLYSSVAVPDLEVSEAQNTKLSVVPKSTHVTLLSDGGRERSTWNGVVELRDSSIDTHVRSSRAVVRADYVRPDRPRSDSDAALFAVRSADSAPDVLRFDHYALQWQLETMPQTRRGHVFMRSSARDGVCESRRVERSEKKIHTVKKHAHEQLTFADVWHLDITNSDVIDATWLLSFAMKILFAVLLMAIVFFLGVASVAGVDYVSALSSVNSISDVANVSAAMRL